LGLFVKKPNFSIEKPRTSRWDKSGAFLDSSLGGMQALRPTAYTDAGITSFRSIVLDCSLISVPPFGFLVVSEFDFEMGTLRRVAIPPDLLHRRVLAVTAIVEE
jgi:hypothetical protein